MSKAQIKEFPKALQVCVHGRFIIPLSDSDRCHACAALRQKRERHEQRIHILMCGIATIMIVGYSLVLWDTYFAGK